MSNIKNLLYMSSVQMANYIFPLVTIPIVSRAFGPQNIGLINYVAAIVGYFSLFVNYSFNYTGVRWLTRNPKDKDKLFWGVFSIQFFIFLLCTIVFYFCVLFFNGLRDYSWICWVSYFSCLASLFTQNWFLQAYSDFKIIAAISFLTKLVSFLLIIFLVKDASDLILYVMIVNVVSFLTSLIVFLYAIKRYKIRFILPDINLIKGLTFDGGYLFFSSVVTNIYTTTGIVMLGALSTKVDVGFYTSAQKLMDVSKSIILMPISQIIFPILSKKFGDGKDFGIYSVRKILPLFIIISLAFLFFINSFNHYIVLILFGEKFLPITPLVSILSIGVFAVFFGVFIGGQVMLNLGMDRAFLKIQVYIAVFSLILNFFFIRMGGGVVTAMVWTISEIVISLYQIIYLKRKGVDLFTWDILTIKSIKESVNYVLKRKY